MAGMTQAQIQPTPDGAIVFDATALPQAPDPEIFEPAFWLVRGDATAAGAGRGGALHVTAPFGHAVLRHYRRGGLVARLLGDRYAWTGAERTRSFAEFRLLQALRGRDLRVPQPLAARYRRSGAYYRADIITRRIDAATTLADQLAQGRLDAGMATRVGDAIAGFHANGACHADLNAHNVMLTVADVWLIDFDRGALRAPARGWQQANLARLQRSLRKLGAARAGEAAFAENVWRPLVGAYEKAMAS